MGLYKAKVNPFTSRLDLVNKPTGPPPGIVTKSRIYPCLDGLNAANPITAGSISADRKFLIRGIAASAIASQLLQGFIDVPKDCITITSFKLYFVPDQLTFANRVRFDIAISNDILNVFPLNILTFSPATIINNPPYVNPGSRNEYNLLPILIFGTNTASSYAGSLLIPRIEYTFKPPITFTADHLYFQLNYI